VPLDAQAGHRLRVVVSAADIVGEATQTSAPTEVIPPRPSARPLQLPTVSAFVIWHFARSTRGVTVVKLSVDGLSPGETISLTCTGTSCVSRRSPLARRGHCSARRCTRTESSGGDRQTTLAQLFKGLRLKAGARITIAIVKGGMFGRLYSFVIKPRQSTVETSSCLQPGSFTATFAC
jgi:hypothetical protein